MINPFTSDGIWLRINLHTHTTQSDGALSPEEAVQAYCEAGYDAICITDHRLLADFEHLSRDNFLVINGQEMHPEGNRHILYHLLAVGLSKQIACENITPQECIDQAREAGGLVYMAHPYWCGLTSADVFELDGLAGLEVWNATCRRHGKASSEVVWEELLEAGLMLPAIAVDDCHRKIAAEHCPGEFMAGWVIVRAKVRTRESICEALAQGSYYASCGPEIKDFRIIEDCEASSGWSAIAEFSACREVRFVSHSSTGRAYIAAPDSSELTSFSHPVHVEASYVRLVVIDVEGNCAWSGPICLPGD
jgi:PHP domain